MSLPEYIPTDLPQYAPLTDRADLNNAVIGSGHALIFAESDGADGTQLAAKLPDGTFQTLGGGGSSGGGMSIYKCASVDATAQTWTGYKAILGSGSYTFETTATTGLTYTSVTPVVGTIYSMDALITVGTIKLAIQTDGLVFYAPLDSDNANAETGQALTKNGTVTYAEVDNIPCAHFSPGYLSFNDQGFPSGTQPRTITFWVKEPTPLTSKKWTMLLSYGASNNSQRFCVAEYYGTALGLDIFYADIYGDSTLSFSAWKFVAVTVEGASVKCYVNGDLYYDKTLSLNTVVGGDGAGCIGNYWDSPPSGGYMAACRVYNRILTSDELNALASEFAPSV